MLTVTAPYPADLIGKLDVLRRQRGPNGRAFRAALGLAAYPLLARRANRAFGHIGFVAPCLPTLICAVPFTAQTK